jgi:Mor family transcriptional regulator
MDSVVKSVYESQDEILKAILKLHCVDGFDCDMTYGNGAFWKNIPRPKLCFDISPQKPEAMQGDSRYLPIPESSIASAVFDPPFLTYVKNGRNHKNGKVAMTSRFGGYWTYQELEDHYRDSISEAYRILKPKGHLVFKCQDIIHNHKMHSTHNRVILMAEIEGFRLCDLFILVAKHRMPSPQKGKQRHARIFHSYFLVFQKSK